MTRPGLERRLRTVRPLTIPPAPEPLILDLAACRAGWRGVQSADLCWADRRDQLTGKTGVCGRSGVDGIGLCPPCREDLFGPGPGGDAA